MDNIFRSLFGFPNRKGYPSSRSPEDSEVPFGMPFPPERGCGCDDNDDNHDNGLPFHEGDSFLFTRPDDIFRQFDHMFTRFDDIFRSFGMPSFDNGQGEGVIMPELPPPERKEVSPRDRMLKLPDTTPPHNPEHSERTRDKPSLFGKLWGSPIWGHRTQSVEDEDLDESVRSGGLDKIFDGRGPELVPTEPKHRSAFNHVSVQTKRSSDGRVEETRTFLDGQGNKQTVVSRTIDGQTIQQTTKWKQSGEQEVVEELINMNEKDKEEFEKKWRTPNRFNARIEAVPRNEVLKELDTSDSDSAIFRKLFGSDFPSFRRG